MIRSASPASLNRITFRFASCALLSAFAFNAPRTAAQTPAQPTRRIVVSIPHRKLALLENNRIVKIYDVSVGASASPSPSGEFRIARRLENPTYYKPGVVIGPGNSNPLGPRWIGLDVKGFGIHGTNRPDSIGKNASHGCIRLRNRDIEDLFARVKVGDHVSLVAERTDEVARLFGTAPRPVNAPETLLARNEHAASQEVEAHDGR
ncbi:MAG TPA: L,D-transpeptidase [Candidatus Sulfotelmatobacter sp.]|nr:L,D-transpeptidase [Candidatus Sulfotelmatobacter sp.]